MMIHRTHMAHKGCGIFALLSLLLLASCGSTKPTARAQLERERIIERDTIRDSVMIVRDSVARDSVIVRASGDTIYVDRWHTRAVYRERAQKAARVVIKTDTLRLTKTETLTASEPRKTRLKRILRAGLAGGAVGAALMAWLAWLARHRRGGRDKE